MKMAIRITVIHLLLIALLSILANIDSASWCSGACETASYFGALALLFFVYPGLMVVTQLIPYNHSSPVPMAIWLASGITTGAMQFILVSMLTRVFSQDPKA